MTCHARTALFLYEIMLQLVVSSVSNTDTLSGVSTPLHSIISLYVKLILTLDRGLVCSSGKVSFPLTTVTTTTVYDLRSFIGGDPLNLASGVI
jgi:hypothetical protein